LEEKADVSPYSAKKKADIPYIMQKVILQMVVCGYDFSHRSWCSDKSK
jgi:hypothetical protein